MRHLLIALTCLSLFSGCKKDAPTSGASDQETEAVEQQAAAGDSVEPVEDEGKIDVTADVMDRYAAYWEQELTLMAKAAKELEALGRDINGKEGLSAGMKALSGSNDITERYRIESEKARKASGFTEAQTRYLQGLVSSVALPRLMITRGGSNEAMIKQMKEGIAELPADRRAEAETQIAEMQKGFEDLKNAAEARKEYGDAAVEAVIRHEDRLLPLYERLMKNDFNKK